MAQPFIKYPGGKRSHQVISMIREHWPVDTETYCEPMIGGGAVFFALQEAGLLDEVHCILSDKDADLIDLYAAIRKDPHRVHRRARYEADHIATAHSEAERKKGYNSLRELWNLGDRRPGYQLYLRHACYNSLFRLSQTGHMNTPPRDNLDRVILPQVPELLNCAQALEDAILLDWDFRRLEAELFVGPGTVVYLDPPYDGEGVFREYTPGGFTPADQQELVELAAEWSRRGARVFYTNANTQPIREVLSSCWSEAHVVEVRARRSISSDGDRTPAPEVIAWH